MRNVENKSLSAIKNKISLIFDTIWWKNVLYYGSNSALNWSVVNGGACAISESSCRVLSVLQHNKQAYSYDYVFAINLHV